MKNFILTWDDKIADGYKSAISRHKTLEEALKAKETLELRNDIKNLRLSKVVQIEVWDPLT